MTASRIFQKALLLLDRGSTDGGHGMLRAAVAEAEQEHDELTLGGARCALGELLMAAGELEQARALLEVVAATRRRDDFLDDRDREGKRLSAAAP